MKPIQPDRVVHPCGRRHSVLILYDGDKNEENDDKHKKTSQLDRMSHPLRRRRRSELISFEDENEEPNRVFQPSGRRQCGTE